MNIKKSVVNVEKLYPTIWKDELMEWRFSIIYDTIIYSKAVDEEQFSRCINVEVIV